MVSYNEIECVKVFNTSAKIHITPGIPVVLLFFHFSHLRSPSKTHSIGLLGWVFVSKRKLFGFFMVFFLKLFTITNKHFLL